VGALCPQTPLQASCDRLPQLESLPTIDGVLECGVVLRNEPMTWSLTTPPPDDFKIRWAAAFHQRGLYVFVEVAKNAVVPSPTALNPWCGDAVHIFIDPDATFVQAPAYDAVGTRQFICVAPSSSALTASRCMVFDKRATERQIIAPTVSTERMTSFRSPDGYRFEGFFGSEDLGLSADWTLASGQRVGFNLSVDYGGVFANPSNPACPGREGEYVLRLAPGTRPIGERMPHNNTNAFCTSALTPVEPIRWTSE
jgi:hypothetical protein